MEKSMFAGIWLFVAFGLQTLGTRVFNIPEYSFIPILKSVSYRQPIPRFP